MRLTRSFSALLLALGMISALLVHWADSAAPVSAAGIGIASRNPDIEPGADVEKLQAAGAGWTYAWRYRNIPDRSPGFDVVPMIRTKSSILSDTVEVLTDKRVSGAFKYLLGFNEPDNANQANLTPTQAADLWPKLQQTGLILGSPAPAAATNGWLKSFMAIAKKRGYRIDFIALHYYANITDTGAVARIKSEVQAIRTSYGRPVWVTELGIIDRRTTNIGSDATNWAKAVKLMQSMTSMLDTLTYVQRFAWVTDEIASTQKHLRWSALYNSTGSLTPLGKAYAALD